MSALRLTRRGLIVKHAATATAAASGILVALAIFALVVARYIEAGIS